MTKRSFWLSLRHKVWHKGQNDHFDQRFSGCKIASEIFPASKPALRKDFFQKRIAYTILVLEPSAEQFLKPKFQKKAKSAFFDNFSSDASAEKTPL